MGKKVDSVISCLEMSISKGSSWKIEVSTANKYKSLFESCNDFGNARIYGLYWCCSDNLGEKYSSAAGAMNSNGGTGSKMIMPKPRKYVDCQYLR